MPKKAQELTALHVKRMSAPGYHAVGGVAGLYLQVTESGARSWILRTVIAGKRRDVGLGGYPDVTLEQARAKARLVKAEIVGGSDPVAVRAAARAELRAAVAAAMTFDEAFRKFFAHKSHEFSSDKYRKYWQDTMRLYVSPIIGKLPVPAIQLPHILSVLEPIWIEKSATASKVRQRIEAVLDWCTVRGVRSGDNPARWDGNLAVLLPKPSKINGGTKHHDALPVADLPAFMADLRERGGVAARAMELAVLCASRTSEVIGAQWHEFDLAGKAWTVPAERMKAKREHVVPLTDAAVALLKSLPRSPGSDYVFDKNGKKLADSALYNLLKVRMQVDATPHGFRSSFKDWARTMTQYADEVSELCLAHVDSDSTRAAYARDGLLDLRRKMLKDWANYLKRSK